jgi:hypothetical protein
VGAVFVRALLHRLDAFSASVGALFAYLGAVLHARHAAAVFGTLLAGMGAFGARVDAIGKVVGHRKISFFEVSN